MENGVSKHVTNENGGCDPACHITACRGVFLSDYERNTLVIRSPQNRTLKQEVTSHVGGFVRHLKILGLFKLTKS